MKNQYKRREYDLILSAGRTGTTYLAQLLEALYEEAAVLQEPIPSRSIYMLLNAADYGWPTRRMAFELYQLSRRLWSSQTRASKIIEINPFISGLAPQLVPSQSGKKVLHIVRHPYSWISSMMVFKGYSWRAFVTPFLPFVYGKPTMHQSSWRALSTPEKFAWRWIDVNQNIMATADAGFLYKRVKYEDLFGNPESRYIAITEILKYFGLNTNGISEYLLQQSKKVNSAPADTLNKWDDWDKSILNKVEKIVAPLVERLDY